MGHLSHLSRPGHHFDPVWDPSFSGFRKKAQDKDRKIYIFVKIRPTVIEILTFNKWPSKFYFPEACKRQTAIKTGKHLTHCKRLSATYSSLQNRVTGSTGSPGRWIPGSLGRWVTKCDPVPCLLCRYWALYQYSRGCTQLPRSVSAPKRCSQGCF